MTISSDTPRPKMPSRSSKWFGYTSLHNKIHRPSSPLQRVILLATSSSGRSRAATSPGMCSFSNRNHDLHCSGVRLSKSNCLPCLARLSACRTHSLQCFMEAEAGLQNPNHCLNLGQPSTIYPLRCLSPFLPTPTVLK